MYSFGSFACFFISAPPGFGLTEAQDSHFRCSDGAQWNWVVYVESPKVGLFGFVVVPRSQRMIEDAGQLADPQYRDIVPSILELGYVGVTPHRQSFDPKS